MGVDKVHNLNGTPGAKLIRIATPEAARAIVSRTGALYTGLVDVLLELNPGLTRDVVAIGLNELLVRTTLTISFMIARSFQSFVQLHPSDGEKCKF